MLPEPASDPSLPAGSPPPNKDVLCPQHQHRHRIAHDPAQLRPGFVPLNCHQTGASVPADVQQQCIDYCEGSINQALDLLFNHPNTEVMVARQLIQRLVTSNPTAGYVQRVAQKFANNGAGVRGDMKATVRAVLMDAEARRPFNAANQPLNFGKVREPMLKQVALWRHFNAISGDTALLPGDQPAGWQRQPARRPARPASLEHQQQPAGQLPAAAAGRALGVQLL